MGIEIKRIGHVGLLVADFERFDDVHHDLVLGSAPQGVDVTAAGPRERLIQQLAFEVEDRDAFLKARPGPSARQGGQVDQWAADPRP